MLKSANESLTRVVVYVSLMALYVLGGSKVNAVRHRNTCNYNIWITLFLHLFIFGNCAALLGSVMESPV